MSSKTHLISYNLDNISSAEKQTILKQDCDNIDQIKATLNEYGTLLDIGDRKYPSFTASIFFFVKMGDTIMQFAYCDRRFEVRARRCPTLDDFISHRFDTCILRTFTSFLTLDHLEDFLMSLGHIF